MWSLLGCLPRILGACGNSWSDVEILQNKNLQDLVQVLNGGSVQVLLVVLKSVPNGGEGGGDEVEDVDTWRRQRRAISTCPTPPCRCWRIAYPCLGRGRGRPEPGPWGDRARSTPQCWGDPAAGSWSVNASLRRVQPLVKVD